MNNKQIGTAFEREAVQMLSDMGYWVHFITPDERGAQPFDIIAVKDGNAIAIDCKTSARHVFSHNRLELNQKMAFGKWLCCGNSNPIILVKHRRNVYQVPYSQLAAEGSVDLSEHEEWIIWRF